MQGAALIHMQMNIIEIITIPIILRTFLIHPNTAVKGFVIKLPISEKDGILSVKEVIPSLASLRTSSIASDA
jgi:hypothetical protein